MATDPVLKPPRSNGRGANNLLGAAESDQGPSGGKLSAAGGADDGLLRHSLVIEGLLNDDLSALGGLGGLEATCAFTSAKSVV